MTDILNIEKNGFDITIEFNTVTMMYEISVRKGTLFFKDEFAHFDNALNHCLDVINAWNNSLR